MKEEKEFIITFEITISPEGGYYRLNVTHPSFKGKVRKRIGNGNQEKYDTLLSHLKVELEKYFFAGEISKEAVESFVNYSVEMYYKKFASIFDYFPEFIKSKQET